MEHFSVPDIRFTWFPQPSSSASLLHVKNTPSNTAVGLPHLGAHDEQRGVHLVGDVASGGAARHRRHLVDHLEAVAPLLLQRPAPGSARRGSIPLRALQPSPTGAFKLRMQYHRWTPVASAQYCDQP